MWKTRLWLALLLLGAVHLRASTVIPTNVARQVDEADLIFVGTVTELKTVPTKDGSFAWTYVTLSVDETLKGSSSAPLLTLRTAGGRVGNYEYEVAGAPAFKEGGRHVLFILGNDRYGIPFSGGPQGKLNLVSHPVTQEEIVVDDLGRVIDGIREGRFTRNGMKIGANGELHKPQAVAQVLSEEGVTVTLDQPPSGDEAAPAWQVLGELRELIQKRAFAKDFRRSAAVESASPENAPAIK